MSAHWENSEKSTEDRLMGRSLLRGMTSKCPKCGNGQMFSKFLKVADNCNHCGEELHHHRADDFPPYLTMTLVAHIIVPAMLIVEKNMDTGMWMLWAIWLPLTAFLTGGLMQPVKGAIVAWQWAMGMHGFARDNAQTDCDGPDSGLAGT